MIQCGKSMASQCPYCGKEMMYADTGVIGLYVCPKCDSRSPGVGGFSTPMTERERRRKASEVARIRFIDGDTSDGYHTFNELYDHRAKLFSVIVKNYPSLCWKSKLHSDGSMFDDMFIVGIDTPSGQATYHYNIDLYWDLFECKEVERAPEWDGHTSAEAIDRIASLKRSINMPWG